MKINALYYVQEGFSRDLLDIHSLDYNNIISNIQKCIFLPENLNKYYSNKSNTFEIKFNTTSSFRDIIDTLETSLSKINFL